MTYELWNMRTGNAVGEFATKVEALAFVRDSITRNGRSYAELLFLGATSRGRSEAIVQGPALTDLAIATGSPEERSRIYA